MLKFFVGLLIGSFAGLLSGVALENWYNSDEENMEDEEY